MPRVPAAVCSDPAEAVALAAAGRDVVVVVAPASVPPAAVPQQGRAGGGGRIAVFVGDPGDPAVMEAAAAMASEVFGGTPRPEAT